MDQFWMWHYPIANAMANIMLAGSSQIALGLLDLWTYPDVRLGRLQHTQDGQNQ
jgi:hypothetical protein